MSTHVVLQRRWPPRQKVKPFSYDKLTVHELGVDESGCLKVSFWDDELRAT